MSGRAWVTLWVILVAALAMPQLVWADFHLWRIDQIYSNASGTVQFIEMHNTDNGEELVKNQVLSSGLHDFTFPDNLSTESTADHRLLLATPGYFALSGVPLADFNLGVNNFFAVGGDTLNYANLNVVTYTGAQLPKDGLNALLINAAGSPSGPAVNSPTNFAGTNKSIPRWENQENRFNVNNAGGVASIDVLQVINELLANGNHALAAPSAGNAPPPFVDVDGSNTVSSLDALQVINELQRLFSGLQPQAQALSLASPDSGLVVVAAPEPSGMALGLCAGIAIAAQMKCTSRKRKVARLNASS